MTKKRMAAMTIRAKTGARESSRSRSVPVVRVEASFVKSGRPAREKPFAKFCVDYPSAPGAAASGGGPPLPLAAPNGVEEAAEGDDGSGAAGAQAVHSH